MTTTKSDCAEVQAAIAWATPLTDTQQEHLHRCPLCRADHARMLRLDAAMDSALQQDVPSGFSERVMTAVANEPLPQLSTAQRLVRFGSSDLAQILLVLAASAVGIGNILRFVVVLFLTQMAVN